MSEPTLQSLSAQLKALEVRLSSLHDSAISAYSQEVSRLQRQLVEFSAQQSAMILVLQELLPGFSQKLEEVRKAEEKALRDSADQIVQKFATEYGKKRD